MIQIKPSLVVSIIVFLSMPLSVLATPVLYTVKGTVNYEDGARQVSGTMTISGILDWHMNASPPTLHISIESYYINTGLEIFLDSQDAGEMLFEAERDSVGWRQSVLWEPTNSPNYWILRQTFFNKDGTLYDYSNIYAWQEVAPLITMIGDCGGRYLDLTLENTAPIPEPTTLLLLSSGLIGLASLRQKINN